MKKSHVKLVSVTALVLSLSIGLARAGGPGSAPEPDGLWTGPMHSYTPSTLKGATVITTDALAQIAKRGGLLIDVSEADHKPDKLPATAIWRPQHRSIPGAIWFPGAGAGILKSSEEEELKSRVDALTGGDKAKPIVAFCHPDCWGSWNMGKRLVAWGYAKVSWYPQGIDGWQQSDRDTEVTKGDPDWLSLRASATSR